jgi:hypothetical protein
MQYKSVRECPFAAVLPVHRPGLRHEPVDWVEAPVKYGATYPSALCVLRQCISEAIPGTFMY